MRYEAPPLPIQNAGNFFLRNTNAESVKGLPEVPSQTRNPQRCRNECMPHNQALDVSANCSGYYRGRGDYAWNPFRREWDRDRDRDYYPRGRRSRSRSKSRVRRRSRTRSRSARFRRERTPSPRIALIGRGPERRHQVACNFQAKCIR